MAKGTNSSRQLVVWHGPQDGLRTFLRRTIGPKQFEPCTIYLYSTSTPMLLVWARAEVELIVAAALGLTKVGVERVGDNAGMPGCAA